MALPPPRVDMRLPDLHTNPFELPQGPVSSLRIQEEAQVLLERLMNIPALQADRDACLDHLQAITTSILFKTGRPDVPAIKDAEPVTNRYRDMPSPSRQGARAVPPSGVSDAIAPAVDERVLFDAASHLFMSQLRARPLVSPPKRHASMEARKLASPVGGLTREEEQLAGEGYVDAPLADLRAVQSTEEERSDEDEDEEEEESLEGSDAGAQEARRKLKHYRRLRQRQMRQLSGYRSRERVYGEVDTWPFVRARPEPSPPRAVASPPARCHSPAQRATQQEDTLKGRPQERAEDGEAARRRKVSALRSVFQAVACGGKTATALQLAHALKHSHEVSELCGRDAAHEAAATLSALGHDILLELATFLLYLGYLYNAPGPRIERLVASSSSQPDHPSAYSSTKGDDVLGLSGARGADVDDSYHHNSRSSSRSSLHALDLSNCPPTILGDVLSHGPLKTAH